MSTEITQQLVHKDLEEKLRAIILDNEGDRGDIYSDVLRLVKPLVDVLIDVSSPTGAYSTDALQHANNTIQNISSIAKDALDDLANSVG